MLLVLCLAWPQAASAGPRQAASQRASTEHAADPIGTRSQSGMRRGGLEFGLGTLLTATAGGLIGFGVLQFQHARQQADFCAVGGGGSGIDPCVFDPPSLGYASAGLSWSFSAILLVGAGLLLTRGARVHADARAYQRLQLSVSGWGLGRSGGGATLRLRF